jgi:photosystem II stability/assembly factor-like uncharacterized protein
MRPSFLRCLPLVLLLAIPRRAAPIDRWTSLGPDGGAIWSLATDPAAPGTVYAGTYGGGVWKSVDGGGHWTPTPEGLGNTWVSALAVSSGRVLAGTGSGIYVLTEGAAAWRQVWRQAGPLGSSVASLAADPTSPGQLWAGTNVGYLLLSVDGGEHWHPRLDLESIGAVAVAPTAPSTLYVEAADGFFKSTDTGTTWRQIVPHLPAPGEGPESTDGLVVDSVSPDTLYTRGWKSADTGDTWTRTPLDPLLDAPPVPLLSLPGGLLGRDDGGLLHSGNGGETWERVLFPPFHVLSLTADPATPDGAFLGTEGQGVFRLLDGGRAWTESNRGLAASEITGFAFDPFQTRTLYATTFATGLHRSVDAGVSWSPIPFPARLAELAGDPWHPGTLYAISPDSLVVSRDRGAHWAPLLSASLDSLTLSPSRSGTIFAGGYGFVARSRNGGLTWRFFPTLPPDSTGGFRPRARRTFIAPWPTETLYFVEEYFNGAIVLARSTDGGETQKTVFDKVPTALAFDPRTPGLLYLADSLGEIWRSRDSGTTWKRIARKAGGGAPPTELLVDASHPTTLYLGTGGAGVWRSRDSGVTWEPFSTGIIAPSITCLQAEPRNPRHLIACTRSGGLLEIRLSS